jgi:hypothetical protein
VDIIGVIDGIAFQTNILALKTAVEAACVGAALDDSQENQGPDRRRRGEGGRQR